MKEWRCFHCDEVFTNYEAAAAHFGVQIDSCADEVACKLTTQEKTLVEMLREAQAELRRYHQEDTEQFRMFYALGASHGTALRQEEEKGYQRGLRDSGWLTVEEWPDVNWGSIIHAQREVVAWASVVFPKRTPINTVAKAYEELAEAAREPDSALELADVFILLLDLAHLNGIDLPRAIAQKMVINQQRQWQWNDRTGLAQHLKNNREPQS